MRLRRPSYYVPSPHDPSFVAAIGHMSGAPDVADIHLMDVDEPRLLGVVNVELDDGSPAPLIAVLVGLGFISETSLVSLLRHEGPHEELPPDALDVWCLLYSLGKDRRALIEEQYDA